VSPVAGRGATPTVRLSAISTVVASEVRSRERAAHRIAPAVLMCLFTIRV
jgi:hypothetical protein